MSPYNYCGGNPASRFDLNGMDWWEIDNTGRVVNRGESQDYDTFFMVKMDENGSYVKTGKSINLNFKSVLSHRSIY